VEAETLGQQAQEALVGVELVALVF